MRLIAEFDDLLVWFSKWLEILLTKHLCVVLVSLLVLMYLVCQTLIQRCSQGGKPKVVGTPLGTSFVFQENVRIKVLQRTTPLLQEFAKV